MTRGRLTRLGRTVFLPTVTADEVVAMFTIRRGQAAGEVKTAGSVAAELAEVFAVRLAWWGGGGR